MFRFLVLSLFFVLYLYKALNKFLPISLLQRHSWCHWILCICLPKTNCFRVLTSKQNLLLIRNFVGRDLGGDGLFPFFFFLCVCVCVFSICSSVFHLFWFAVPFPFFFSVPVLFVVCSSGKSVHCFLWWVRVSGLRVQDFWG